MPVCWSHQNFMDTLESAAVKFFGFADVLMRGFSRLSLDSTHHAKVQCSTLRVKYLKVAAGEGDRSPRMAAAVGELSMAN